jgi:hypothetical protein
MRTEFLLTVSCALIAVALPQTTPDVAALSQAVSQWHNNTAAVSTFLEAGKVGSQLEFKLSAADILRREITGLKSKAIIDNFFGTSNANITNANAVLVTQGNFQDVVNGLMDFAQNGLDAQTNTVTLAVNRCGRELPAIDIYFAEVNKVTKNSPLTAVRPVGIPGCPGVSPIINQPPEKQTATVAAVATTTPTTGLAYSMSATTMISTTVVTPVPVSTVQL